MSIRRIRSRGNCYDGTGRGVQNSYTRGYSRLLSEGRPFALLWSNICAWGSPKAQNLDEPLNWSAERIPNGFPALTDRTDSLKTLLVDMELLTVTGEYAWGRQVTFNTPFPCEARNVRQKWPEEWVFCKEDVQGP